MKKYSIIFLCVSLFLGACSSPVSEKQDWNKIISSYQDDSLSFSYDGLARLNLALNETGQLVDKAFCYTQAGFGGLLPEWRHNQQTGELLSDIYFSIGHTAMAQRMAFETHMLDDGKYSQAMMLRLIQTNLIYGAYPVAQKYIQILKQDRKTASAAKAYERFLGDDQAVADDPVLGPRKAALPQQDFLAITRGIDQDLRDIIHTDPSNTKAVEFLGMIYLLDCDFDGFRSFLDEFYGTEALPELHGAFAEAACLMSELERGYWTTVGVKNSVHKQYLDFLKRLENRLDLSRYSQTFWYYVMSVNSMEQS